MVPGPTPGSGNLCRGHPSAPELPRRPGGRTHRPPRAPSFGAVPKVRTGGAHLRGHHGRTGPPVAPGRPPRAPAPPGLRRAPCRARTGGNERADVLRPSLRGTRACFESSHRHGAHQCRHSWSCPSPAVPCHATAPCADAGTARQARCRSTAPVGHLSRGLALRRPRSAQCACFRSWRRRRSSGHRKGSGTMVPAGAAQRPWSVGVDRRARTPWWRSRLGQANR